MAKWNFLRKKRSVVPKRHVPFVWEVSRNGRGRVEVVGKVLGFKVGWETLSGQEKNSDEMNVRVEMRENSGEQSFLKVYRPGKHNTRF